MCFQMVTITLQMFAFPLPNKSHDFIVFICTILAFLAQEDFMFCKRKHRSLKKIGTEIEKTCSCMNSGLPLLQKKGWSNHNRGTSLPPAYVFIWRMQEKRYIIILLPEISFWCIVSLNKNSFEANYAQTSKWWLLHSVVCVSSCWSRAMGMISLWRLYHHRSPSTTISYNESSTIHDY